ncbi:MAG: NAD(P)H-dependent oxidoreductase subunit E [Solobacterium sp.]|nr:NAD(P)H-dependent oxidoreductase subunit E [Solobacterium sp.]MBQ9824388.1 NAD(P)H-dependent oxidoreductase subunit E [Solobacterium sp.]
MERLNGAALAKIDEIVASHKGEPGPCIVMLHDVQNELGYVPFEAMEKIADACGTSVAEVYGVVMFYAQFTTEPKGKHVINICLGTACYVKGGQKLVDQAVELTGAPINGTSDDGLFSLDATRCLGACGLAPVAVVDGKVIGAATEGNKLLTELKAIINAEKSASLRS